MKKMIFVICLVMCLTGCAAFKKTIRTVNDIAADLCLLFASEKSEDELFKLTPEQWCEVKSNLEPFIEEILEAKASAGQELGYKKESE